MMGCVATRMAWAILAGAVLYGMAYCTAPPASGPMVSKMQDLPPKPAPEVEEPSLAGVETHNCPRPFLERFDLPAASGGPLRLELISCGAFPAYSRNPGVLSPDGEKLARWSDDREAGLELARTTGGQLLTFQNRLTFRNFASGRQDDPTEGFAWTPGSDGFWTVRQDVLRTSGFAVSDLRPIRVGLDGQVHELPTLRDAGRLDAIRWVGPNGLALAQFWTRGGRYRPDQPNSEPTLATVDAARGRVRHAIRARDLPPLRQRAEAGDLHVNDAAATVMPDGRVRSVVEFAAWREPPAGSQSAPVVQPGYVMTWTEGAAPRLRALRERSRSAISMAMSPDGSRLLVLRRLQPEGVIIRERPRPAPPGPPPTPVDGVFAELIDLSSGRQVWRLRARVEANWNQRPQPAISPDGRMALLNLPPDGRHQIFALVGMRDGAILHRFSVTQIGSLPAAFGFSPDGRRIWVTVAGTLFRYRLDS